MSKMSNVDPHEGMPFAPLLCRYCCCGCGCCCCCCCCCWILDSASWQQYPRYCELKSPRHEPSLEMALYTLN